MTPLTHYDSLLLTHDLDPLSLKATSEFSSEGSSTNLSQTEKRHQQNVAPSVAGFRSLALDPTTIEAQLWRRQRTLILLREEGCDDRGNLVLGERLVEGFRYGARPAVPGSEPADVQSSLSHVVLTIVNRLSEGG